MELIEDKFYRRSSKSAPRRSRSSSGDRRRKTESNKKRKMVKEERHPIKKAKENVMPLKDTRNVIQLSCSSSSSCEESELDDETVARAEKRIEDGLKAEQRKKEGASVIAFPTLEEILPPTPPHLTIVKADVHPVPKADEEYVPQPPTEIDYIPTPLHLIPLHLHNKMAEEAPPKDLFQPPRKREGRQEENIPTGIKETPPVPSVQEDPPAGKEKYQVEACPSSTEKKQACPAHTDKELTSPTSDVVGEDRAALCKKPLAPPENETKEEKEIPPRFELQPLSPVETTYPASRWVGASTKTKIGAWVDQFWEITTPLHGHPPDRYCQRCIQANGFLLSALRAQDKRLEYPDIASYRPPLDPRNPRN